MRIVKKYVFTFLLIAIAAASALAQAAEGESDYLTWQTHKVSASADSNTAKPFIIRKVIITGNRKTKENIIRRELPFMEDEQYQLPVLVEKFAIARRQLMNTALFHDAVVSLKSMEGYDVDVLVHVSERWYLFPIPYFKPVDRNINQWLIEQNASLDRVDYGIKLLYNNATGRNDKLNLWLINGYNKQAILNYDRLYIDKRMKWGFNMGIKMGKNHEVNYATIGNKQVFYKDPDTYIRSFLNVNAELTYRKAIKTRHHFGVAYNEEKVNDTVVALNASYYKTNYNRIRVPEVYYKMVFFDVDYIPYPLKGHMAELSFSKKGFGGSIDAWEISAKAGASWPVANKTWTSVKAAAGIKFPFSQPYINQRMLGYRDFFMQGYEYYVMDGAAAGYIKASVTREVVHFNIRSVSSKIKQGNIPFRVFVKAYVNAGYAHHPHPGPNPLNNKMLYSAGMGIDIITFYDFILKIEWSFNQLGENGVYLHRKSYY